MQLGNWKTRLGYDVKKTKISLQDEAINLGTMTEVLDESLFRIERGEIYRVWGWEDEVMQGV